ncbi:MAG TPA: CatA-like O-acetyltransferase [Longimicrobiaceae bacterium]|nr:CatA-like O-acetyltransferase [Longimicrobiaceae bacterium]
MGRYLDLDRWTRRAHFLLFRGYERPHFSVTAEVDVSGLYAMSRLPDGPSFFLGTLFATMHAANAVEAFRLRLRGDRVWCHDTLGIGSTVPRPDRTFGFGTFPYRTSLAEFAAHGRAELERVRASTDLLDEGAQDDAQVHATALPWMRFTGYTNALRRDDSVPKICFGRRHAVGDAWRMPVAVEVHHALVDGIDVGEFFERLQEILARPLPA